ncbi:MAG: putative rane protein [Clostridia bacterium]|jgi:uncharacterized membrane protein required for colicin V production|nr:putative rane protein [Clostridia bacterium]
MDLAISAGLDIIIVVIFLLCFIIGANKGLIKSVISLLGKIASLIIAFIFSENLGIYINTNYIREPMQKWLVNSLSATSEGMDVSLADLNLDQLFKDMPDFFKNIGDFLKINLPSMGEKYEAWKENGIEQAKSAVTSAMVAPLSELISRIIAFIIIFILCCIVVSIIWWLSDLIVNIPVIRQLDKLGGALFGIVNGILLTFIIVSIINISSTYILKDRTAEQRQSILDKTFIYKIVNDINPLNSLFNSW